MKRLPVWFARAFTLALLLSAGQCAFAQDRGTQVEAPKASETPQGKRYVVAIGVNDYENWPKLSTAVNDATGFADLLVKQFGYELAAPPLTQKQVTRAAVESLLDDDLRAKLKQEDDLVIFFAGHGTTRQSTVGDQVSKIGFLVPYDAHAPGIGERWSDYIKVDELLRTISDLPARHILVILDSCHSGLALGTGFSTSRGLEHLTADMQRKRGRKVIASAEGDQMAADRGPLPGHSLFTGLMMQGLISGKADNFGQGFITSTQLGVFVQHEVSVAEQSKQTPLFGTFGDDGGGELLLPTAGDFQSLFTQAFDALKRVDQAAFDRFAQKAIALSPDSPRGLWLEYETALLDGKTELAAEKLRSLHALFVNDPTLPDQLLPMPARELTTMADVLTYWKDALAAPATQDAFSVRLEAGQSGKLAAEEANAEGIYALKSGSDVVLTVKNLSAVPLTIGVIWFSSTGEVSGVSCWGERENPLIQPGGEDSCRVRQDGSQEGVDLHFISTPHSIFTLVHPPSGGTRGFLSSTPLEVADARQRVVRLRFE